MKIFFDTEFTGLHKNTNLISIGLIDETDRTFYAEFNDFPFSQVNDWLRENVIKNLTLTDNLEFFQVTNQNTKVYGSTETIVGHLKNWLSSYDQIEIWSDCLAYDWVLFCDLFGGAFNIPESIYYIPFDLATLFKIKGINPDISREIFAEIKSDNQKHNAIWDAKIIKMCYEKIMKND